MRGLAVAGAADRALTAPWALWKVLAESTKGPFDSGQRDKADGSLLTSSPAGLGSPHLLPPPDLRTELPFQKRLRQPQRANTLPTDLAPLGAPAC